jgi:hypothetical protein
VVSYSYPRLSQQCPRSFEHAVQRRRPAEYNCQISSSTALCYPLPLLALGLLDDTQPSAPLIIITSVLAGSSLICTSDEWEMIRMRSSSSADTLSMVELICQTAIDILKSSRGSPKAESRLFRIFDCLDLESGKSRVEH